MPDPQTDLPPAMLAVPPPSRGGSATQPATLDEDAARRGCDARTIALQGVIDTDGVVRLQQQVSDALTGYDRVVLDLRDVSVLSTSALALLCCALRRAHRPGATLVITGVTQPAEDALAFCELPGVELVSGRTSDPAVAARPHWT